jgi:uncharacterized protein
MKVIIDTNILVSAVLKGREPRAAIQFIVDSPDYEWIVSAEIIAEYKDVNVEIDFTRDRKDAKFLACAVAADADFLITGDLDFTEAQTLVNTTIISVSLFKSLIGDFS